MVYPIKFESILKPKIWGREVWLISDLHGAVSVVRNGCFKGMAMDKLLHNYKDEIIGRGEVNKLQGEFPLLIKIIEAEDKLSVQVHPNDVLAKAKGYDSGKNEMWYVMEAQPNAELVAGLNCAITPDEFEDKVKQGTFSEVLNFSKVSKGDVFNIPAGCVHALGGGIKVAEIQQASDTTFRIYDYERKDKEGKLRELHIEEAKEAINYKDVEEDRPIKYLHKKNQEVPLVKCTSFNTSFYDLTKPMMFDYSLRNSFVIWMCVEGNCLITDENGFSESLAIGEVILIPAVLNKLQVDPCNNVKLLEIW